MRMRMRMGIGMGMRMRILLLIERKGDLYSDQSVLLGKMTRPQGGMP